MRRAPMEEKLGSQSSSRACQQQSLPAAERSSICRANQPRWQAGNTSRARLLCGAQGGQPGGAALQFLGATGQLRPQLLLAHARQGCRQQQEGGRQAGSRSDRHS